MHKPNGRKEDAEEANTTFLGWNFVWVSRIKKSLNAVHFVGFVKPVNFQIGLVANNNDTPVVDLGEVGEPLSSQLGLCKAFFTRDRVHLQNGINLQLGYTKKKAGEQHRKGIYQKCFCWLFWELFVKLSHSSVVSPVLFLLTSKTMSAQSRNLEGSLTAPTTTFTCGRFLTKRPLDKSTDQESWQDSPAPLCSRRHMPHLCPINSMKPGRLKLK